MESDGWQCLSDEMVFKIMSFLTEEKLFEVRLVCQRWYEITQDPHLFEISIDQMKRAWEEVQGGHAKAELEMGRLAETLTKEYLGQVYSNEITKRIRRKREGLNAAIKSFQVCDIIQQILESYQEDTDRKQQVHILAQRRVYFKKLVQQALEEYIFVSVNPDVDAMQKNPFVVIAYKPTLLFPIIRLLDLLSVTEEAQLEAMNLGKARHSNCVYVGEMVTQFSVTDKGSGA